MKKLGVLLLGLVLSIGAPLAAHGAETGTYTIRLNDDGPHTLTVKGKADQHVAGWGTAVPMYCYVWGGPQLRIMSFYVPRTGITKAGRAQVQWGNKLATDDILPPGVEETQTAGRVDLRFTGPGGRNVSATARRHPRRSNGEDQ